MLILRNECQNCNGSNIQAVRLYPIEYAGYWCKDCGFLTESWPLDPQEIEQLGKLTLEKTGAK